MEAPGAAVLAGDKGGKPIIMAAGTDEAVAAGFNAGAIIKAVAPALFAQYSKVVTGQRLTIN